MPLCSEAKAMLGYLQKNPAVRGAIAAPPGKTILYAGSFLKPIWRELDELRRTRPEFADKKTLPDVLAGVRTPGAPFPTLSDWARMLDSVQPWKENGFIIWRALSGIFAANASGPVSFYIGSGVTKDDKVFAATEVPVLLRNPRVDQATKDLLQHYQRCIQQGQSAINLGYIAG